jgi:hypothetical protein
VGDPAVIEAQRRIHELEAQREQEHGEAAAPVMEESRSEPPAFLVKEEARHEERHEERHEPAEHRHEPAEHRHEPREVAREVSPPPPPAPRVDPKELLDQAGLVMIETDRSKAPAPQPAQQEEPAHVGRPRRERTKPAQAEEELQQVETKR